MPTQVIMPQLGESVVEGTVSKWLKAKGESVSEYEPLLEVNTDKVDSEIPSPASGVLLDILVAEGTTVHAGTVLALIGGQGETIPEGPARGSAMKGNGGGQAVEAAREAPAPPDGELSVTHSGRDRDLGFISPVVAKIAQERGVDLTQVQGTGMGGRITKKDVLSYLERGKEKVEQGDEEPVSESASTPAEAPVPTTTTPHPTFSPGTTAPLAPSAPAPERPPLSQPPSVPATQLAAPQMPVSPGEILPITPVRRAIAEHMVHSKHTSPHVTTVMEVDLSRVTAHRAANKETFARDGANLTYTAYFLSTIVTALKTYPMVNSSWSDDGILLHRQINLGMATSLGEDGLIVPVIKNADGLSLLGMARAVNDLANRARARQLKPDEVKGATFTLTNHGTSGSLFATPIINQPQCAILGAGAIQKRVVVVPGPAGEDAIAIRPMAYLSLTFDHRTLDGAVADHFLGKVVELLQNWS